MDLIDLARYRDKRTVLVSNRKFEKPPLISNLMRALVGSDFPVEDSLFDSLLPEYYQKVSSIHWTPIQAIRQLAEFISNCDENSKFLDIGSGCGKLCIILSLLTKMNIYGIEQRSDLFKIAEKIKTINDLQNVHFIRGNMLDLDWSGYDIYYLYNPFQEHIASFGDMRIDERIDFDQKYYVQYTSEVYRQLCWAKPGKKLITFHGYGGSIPSNWRLTQSRIIGYGNFSMWENGE